MRSTSIWHFSNTASTYKLFFRLRSWAGSNSGSRSFKLSNFNVEFQFMINYHQLVRWVLSWSAAFICFFNQPRCFSGRKKVSFGTSKLGVSCTMQFRPSPASTVLSQFEELTVSSSQLPAPDQVLIHKLVFSIFNAFIRALISLYTPDVHAQHLQPQVLAFTSSLSLGSVDLLISCTSFQTQLHTTNRWLYFNPT